MTDESRKLLDKIASLVDSRQLVEAEQICRDALSMKPEDINLQGLMGVIAIRQNEPDKAVPHFRKVLSFDAKNAAAVRGLATALERTGRSDDAELLRDEYMDGLPTERLLAEAESLCRRGEIPDAEKLCDAVLRRDPESREALRVLAIAAIVDERHIIAEAYLSRIVRLHPENVEGIMELARFLDDQGRHNEAITHLDRAASLEPDNPNLHLLLGGMLAVMTRTDESLAAYARCLEKMPDEPAALIGQGHMLRIVGRQAEALESYRHCVNVRPDFGVAWWNLASLPRYEVSDEDVSVMQKQLARPDTTAESLVGLHFALGRAFEKRDDYDAAWSHFASGNAARRAVVKYDPVKIELDQRKIREAYSTEVLAGPSGKPATDVTPIFIVGMPRSGSTLVEQILASHSQVEGAGELHYVVTMTDGLKSRKPGSLHYSELVGELAPDELTEMGDKYLLAAGSHLPANAAYFTDKMPENYAHIGFIRQILPHAKIIDARREPIACCMANYRQLFADGKNYSYDFTELGEYYVEYSKIMDHWDRVLPGDVLRVQYEDVVGDFENQVRRILDFCGLPFEDACLEFHKSARPVNTASAEQVREPIYSSAVEFWRHYEAHLEELKEVLEPVLKA